LIVGLRLQRADVEIGFRRKPGQIGVIARKA
jgi:hypothetical protein